MFLEDAPTAYHTAFLQYITAQGIQCGHAVAIAAFHVPAQRLVELLPACVDRDVQSSESRRQLTDMKIAWRYQREAEKETVEKIRRVTKGCGALTFDLSSYMQVPTGAAISCLGRGVSKDAGELLQHIQAHMERAAKARMASRVVVHGICEEVVGNGESGMQRFLGQLRGLMRMYGGVGVVGCGKEVRERLCLVAGDAVVKVESFGGKGGGEVGLGKEWLGVLIVKKGFGEGRGGGRGRGDVWVFKRGRRRFVMERATAAPEEEGGEGEEARSVEF